MSGEREDVGGVGDVGLCSRSFGLEHDEDATADEVDTECCEWNIEFLVRRRIYSRVAYLSASRIYDESRAQKRALLWRII